MLESGSLLQQVCIAYPNQILKLWVNGEDFARVRVLPESFVQQENNSNLWPNNNEIKDDNSNKCLRLMSNTQVVVTPRPRKTIPSTQVLSKLKLVPCLEDYVRSDAMMQLENISNRSIKSISLPPGTAAIHPNTILQLPDFVCLEQVSIARVCLWYSSDSLPSDSKKVTDKSHQNSTFVRILVSNEVPEKQIGE